MWFGCCRIVLIRFIKIHKTTCRCPSPHPYWATGDNRMWPRTSHAGSWNKLSHCKKETAVHPEQVLDQRASWPAVWLGLRNAPILPCLHSRCGDARLDILHGRPRVLPREAVEEGLPMYARSNQHKSPTDSQPRGSSFLSPDPRPSLTPGCQEAQPQSSSTFPALLIPGTCGGGAGGGACWHCASLRASWVGP